MARNAPLESAVARWASPEESGWDVNSHLLAGIFDVLQTANWQRGGGKGQRPAPMRRPGDAKSPRPEQEPENLNPTGANESGTFKGEVMSQREMANFLGWNDPEPATRDEQIAARYQQGGVTYKQLAAEFGVSVSTVGRVVRSSPNV